MISAALVALVLSGGDAGAATDSVYQLRSAWRDQTGKALELRELGGQVVVLAMIYTSCEGACPLLVNDVQRIERQLPEPLRKKTRFVLASFDPARDTPERLAAYAKAHGLTAPRWVLLAGDDDAVRELAAVLGMRYRRTDSGDFAHSNLITVLDEKGAIAHQQVGLGQDGSATVAAIAAKGR